MIPYLLVRVVALDVHPEAVGGRRGGEGAHAQRRAVVRRAVAISALGVAGRPVLPAGGVACLRWFNLYRVSKEVVAEVLYCN